MAVELERTLLTFAESEVNSNKFYDLRLFADGTVTMEWGRVGSNPQRGSKNNPREYQKLLNAKLKKGYTVFREWKNGVQVGGTLSGTVAPRDDALVSRSLFLPTTVGAQEKKLLDELIASNRHQIDGLSGGAVSVSDSGAITTALGPVTADQVSRARKFLVKLSLSPTVDPKDVSEYLRLIPQVIKNVRDLSWVTAEWVQSQFDLLDAMDSSITLALASDDDDDDAETPLIPFRHRLTLLDDNHDDLADIKSMFARSINTRHSSSRYSVDKVYTLTDSLEGDWTDKGDVRKLWHGTTTGNLLSILRTGFTCPPASSRAHATSGRMFGDGIYFSDQSTKSLNYASGGHWNRGKDSSRTVAMFLSSVSMGKTYKPVSYSHQIPSTARKGYDSIFIKGGTCSVLNNEMIVWNTDQIRTTHLVTFR